MPNWKHSKSLHPMIGDAPGCISLMHIVKFCDIPFFFFFLLLSSLEQILISSSSLLYLQSLINPEK